MLSGTPTAGGNSSFSVKVTDSAGNVAVELLTLAVTTTAALSIGTSGLPAGTYNTAYSATLSAVGGSGTGISWSITSGLSTLTAVNLSMSSGGVISRHAGQHRHGQLHREGG